MPAKLSLYKWQTSLKHFPHSESRHGRVLGSVRSCRHLQQFVISSSSSSSAVLLVDAEITTASCRSFSRFQTTVRENQIQTMPVDYTFQHVKWGKNYHSCKPKLVLNLPPPTLHHSSHYISPPAANHKPFIQLQGPWNVVSPTPKSHICTYAVQVISNGSSRNWWLRLY